MKITQFNEKTAYKSDINPSHRLKTGFTKGVKILDSKFNTLVDYREYWSNAGVCTVCVWFMGNNINFSTSAKAGGYGYHKPSSALAIALHNAGIKFEHSFNGAGGEASINALKAVARHINNFNKKKKLHTVTCFE